MPDCDSASYFSSVFTGVSMCVETNTPINAVRGDAHTPGNVGMWCHCPAIRPFPNAATCDCNSASYCSLVPVQETL